MTNEVKKKPVLVYIRFSNGETIIAYELSSNEKTVLVDKPVYIYTNETNSKKFEYVVSSWLPVGNVDVSEVELKHDQIMYKLPLAEKKLGEMESYMKKLYSSDDSMPSDAQVDEVTEILKKLQKGSK